MDEQRLRTLLTELANEPAPPSSVDPSALFDRGRRSRTIRLQSAAVVVVLLAAIGVTLLLTQPTVTAPSSPAMTGSR